jgi:alginate O-acetyltransferase complex protein AlgI
VIAVLTIAVVLLATFVLGYAASRTRAPEVLGWMLAVAAVFGMDAVTRQEAPFLRMWALIGGLLYAMKAVVARAHGRRTGTALTAAQWCAFALAWPGMDPEPFVRHAACPREEIDRALRRALLALLTGLGLVTLAALVIPFSRVLATILALPGFSLMLHFGLFGWLTVVWRRCGADVDATFDAPWRATTLSEFWGGRWNPAFSEMTSAVVYRPLVRRLGSGTALAAAFAFSGVLHEVAVSLPVRAGFGGPLAYFVLHGALVALERAGLGARLKARPGLGRGWTLACLLAPLPLVFHRPFLAGVVWPLLSR